MGEGQVGEVLVCGVGGMSRAVSRLRTLLKFHHILRVSRARLRSWRTVPEVGR